jgi:rubrerythrin
MTVTLGQAIRNAAEVERAGARFYAMLAERTTNEAARAFFEKLAGDEVVHAEELERQGAELGDQYAAALPEACVKMIESAPGWEQAEEITPEQAFQIALEAENHAALYYDSLADFAEGEVREFFLRLAKMEESHAEVLRSRRDELFG